MADENLDLHSTGPAVVIETVKATKQFLDDELAKSKSWGTSNKIIKGLFDSEKAFDTTKGMGAGQTTILKFLGGHWKQWMVQEALQLGSF